MRQDQQRRRINALRGIGQIAPVNPRRPDAISKSTCIRPAWARPHPISFDLA
jgi:hypothetical protein